MSAAGGYGPASSSYGANDVSTATPALVSALKNARDVRLDAIVDQATGCGARLSRRARPHASGARRGHWRGLPLAARAAV